MRFEQFSMQIFLIQPVIKRPFKFPPHQLSASALPWKCRARKIRKKINKKR